MKQPHFGFSLMELMLVIIIISILSMIAIPSYHLYTKRARYAEVIMTASLFRTAVTLAFQQGVSKTELSNGSFGIPLSPTPTPNLDQILVQNGIITARGSKLTNYATYILTPNDDGSIWTISGSCLQDGLCHV